MKLKLVKPSQGLVWVRQGMLACRQQPLGFIGLIGLTGFFALLMLSLLDKLGSMLAVGFMPLMWMGFMLATRRVLKGERITPTVMIEPIKSTQSPRRDFALLGCAYIVATMAALQLAQWLGPDPDALDKLMESTKDTAELLTNPMVQEDMAWRMALTLPISLLFWHTPALVLWGRQPVAKALFFSAVATWRNLGAFIMYGACWLGVMLAIALADRALLALIPEPLVATTVAMIAGMWMAAAFYASLYFTVVDCFDAPQPGSEPKVVN
jgi:hypothetical protein